MEKDKIIWKSYNVDNISDFKDAQSKNCRILFDDGLICEVSEYKKYPKSFVTHYEDVNEVKESIVLCDVDGTITIVDPIRLAHLTVEHDHERFYLACGNDKPFKDICELVLLFQKTHRLVFCTGRPEYVREQTEGWLYKYLGLSTNDYTLLMRSNGDRREDSVAKPQLLEKAGIKLDNIKYVLEDRNSVVKMWRELGLTVLHVNDGAF